jgi:hypothetical protein
MINQGNSYRVHPAALQQKRRPLGDLGDLRDNCGKGSSVERSNVTVA